MNRVTNAQVGSRELPSEEGLRESLAYMLSCVGPAGADAAEASLAATRALSVSVRDRELETLEHAGDRSAAITVYRGRAKGSAATTDLTAEGLKAALDQALTIARFTEEDECAGLAEAGQMAQEWPDLALYNPWPLTVDQARERALAVETAALDADDRIVKTEGATVATEDSIVAYGNSHGFIGLEQGSHHAVSCSALARAEKDDRMQREMAISQSRLHEELWSSRAVGELAANRALGRLGARTAPTATAPVLFTPRVARSLWAHVFGAISGGALYRQASFLQGRLEQQIMAPIVTVQQKPHRRHGLDSAGFDNDGVATVARDLIRDGTLHSYLLSAYTARRLGMETTGNAGGIFNAEVSPGQDSFDALVSDMGQGLVVTELMGQGVNLVTGDYSRGAAGWWVENGELAWPVENVTIAGNLTDMLGNIAALGNDVDWQSALWTPSVLVGSMTIAGS